MGRLMSGNLAIEQSVRRAGVQTFALFRGEEGVGGQKYQAGPALALAAGQLGQSELAIREGTETVGVVAKSASGGIGHIRGVARRGRKKRWHGRGIDDAGTQSGVGKRAGLWGRFGKVAFDARRCVGFHHHVARRGGRAYILAEIESRDRNRPLRNPAGCLIVACLRRGYGCRLAGGDQSPARRVVEGEIEVRHDQAPIGIPVSAGPYVEQAGASLGQHFPGVNEAQIDLMPLVRRRRQNYGYEVVAVAGELGALHGRVLNEL